LLEATARDLGFHYFALLDHEGLSRPEAAVFRIDNYPEAWATELVERGYACDDPVHLASRRVSAGFGWCELDRLIALGARHRLILARARRFGIGPGLTIPANVPGEPSASCSFAVRAGGELPATRLHCAELVGAHALSAARRLCLAGRPRPPHLSPRERQCARLVALGKTDWEISVILGLSPHTARQYVKRARAAYDTVSRTQLALYGVRDQWIDLSEAIPPSEGMSGQG
jgi:LuxR family quorum-sensing system transcriptional regulator CciR